jgi:hypothetical protein
VRDVERGVGVGLGGRKGGSRDGAGDGGQVLPLVALVVALAGLVVYGLARLGAEAVADAQARTAADAAALAAAASSDRGDGGAVGVSARFGTGARDTAAEAAAAAAARANGARLLRMEWLGRDVRVRVERDGTVATARARRDGEVPPSSVSAGDPPTMTVPVADDEGHPAAATARSGAVPAAWGRWRGG